jgi:hypothetical protein
MTFGANVNVTAIPNPLQSDDSDEIEEDNKEDDKCCDEPKLPAPPQKCQHTLHVAPKRGMLQTSWNEEHDQRAFGGQ